MENNPDLMSQENATQLADDTPSTVMAEREEKPQSAKKKSKKGLVWTLAVLLLLGGLFVLLSSLHLFDHASQKADRLLNITIPESLDYSSAFSDLFDRYLSESESTGVKTTGMGSMFRLSFKVRMKDPAQEKAFIDELRTRNGNLEIALLPWVEAENRL